MATGLWGAGVVALAPRVRAEEPPDPKPLARLDPAGPVAPDPAPAAVTEPGSLVICGGGRLPDAVHDRFLELASGPQARLVVIPTAASDLALKFTVSSLEARWKPRVASLDVLHTRSRTEANDPEFLRPLAGATGVWISGGDQSRLSATYVDTEFERQLKALLARGGVIGGSSAGAAVMTRVMITGGRSRATLGKGFDLLPAAVVDQHFLKRSRLGRMLNILAENPGLAGFGIDEGTALVLRGDRLSVIGDSYVVAYMPIPSGSTTAVEVLMPGDHVDVSWLLAPGAAGKSDPDPELAVRSRTSEPADGRQ
jgi:cyanophycinase